MSNERLQLVCTNFSAYDCSYLYGLDGQMKSELFKLVFQFRVNGMELFLVCLQQIIRLSLHNFFVSAMFVTTLNHEILTSKRKHLDPHLISSARVRLPKPFKTQRCIFHLLPNLAGFIVVCLLGVLTFSWITLYGE